MTLADTGQDIHAVLVEPLVRLSKWATRRKRGVDDTQLHAAAWGMLGAFDELLALPVTELRVEVHMVPAEQPPNVLEDTNERDRLDALLESARNIRNYMSGAASESMLRALRARDPALAPTFEERRAASIARLAEWEQWLVALGAGTEQDAVYGQALVPLAPEDLPAGSSSVRFDL